MRGSTVCLKHGGGAPQTRAKAVARLELLNWGLGDTHTDPGETLLRLLSQSAARAQRYAVELEQLVEEHGLHDALVGKTLVVPPSGGPPVEVGEYVRGLAALEAAERDRCVNFAAKSIAAGLAERTVRLAEKQASIAERALMAALDDIGLTPEQRSQASARLVHHLQLVS
jgi:hypothetical protein